MCRCAALEIRCLVWKWRDHLNSPVLYPKWPDPSHSSHTRLELPIKFWKEEELRILGRKKKKKKKNTNDYHTASLTSSHTNYFLFFLFCWTLKEETGKQSVGMEICCLSPDLLFTCRVNGLARLPMTMLRMCEGLTFILKSSVKLSSTSLWI